MKKILIVEDDKFLMNALRVKLTESDFEVVLAQDGEEALKALESIQPDLILLDLILPKKDGFAVLEEIKRDEKLKKIPVVIISNLGQTEDIERGKKFGAADYIVKADTSIQGIIDKINTIISKSP